MFDSKKTANEIMKTFDSLEKEEQNRILSYCGLSFQKNNGCRQIILIIHKLLKNLPKKTILIKILKPKKI